MSRDRRKHEQLAVRPARPAKLRSPPLAVAVPAEEGRGREQAEEMR